MPTNEQMERQSSPELNREYIRTLLPDMSIDEIDDLIAVLPMDSVQVITGPSTGLIMAKVRDCFDTDFYLGEVLVTRAEVSFGDLRAQATLMGDLPKHTLIAAALEALERGGEADVIERAVKACQPAARRIEQVRRIEAKLTAATCVQFESMAEET
jgi:phosphonate C-P lyase system protein PhnG